MAPSTSNPYRGRKRKLVLGFDVGTTYSGISYSILEPGEIPQIRGITRFPGCQYVSAGVKIPSIIYYDQLGKVRAVGAEAEEEGMLEMAEYEEWVKAEWFKPHISTALGNKEKLPPLPHNKSAVDVLADFMGYLLRCSNSYIQDVHVNGTKLWQSVENDIDFVVSHSNGWRGNEQRQMRKAAVLAGLIPDNAPGHARLFFVTEGEASLHSAVCNVLPSGVLSKGDCVAVVDAGGGTIDISFYAKMDASSRNASVPPNVVDKSDTQQEHVVAFNNPRINVDFFEEVAPSQSDMQGSAFVTIRARTYLEAYLAESNFSDEIDYFVRVFDRSTKIRFRDDTETQYIQRRTASNNTISPFERICVRGSSIAKFFQPAIDYIVNVVLKQMQCSHTPISHVVLVGGFAGNDWLFQGILCALRPHGLHIHRPEAYPNKAVADGAVSFYINQIGRPRVSEFSYGHFCHIPFNRHTSDHRQRVQKAFISLAGQKRMDDSFDIIVPKGTQVSKTSEFRRSYFKESISRSDFDSMSFSVWCYGGLIPEPKWKDVDADNYMELCTIKADLSQLPLRSIPKPGGSGIYYRLDYDVILLFGPDMLRALVSWKELENGSEEYSASKIVYDQDPNRITINHEHSLSGCSAAAGTTTSTSRDSHRGHEPKLVLAFDVGTTYSGISYSVLDPDMIPDILPVMYFPASQHRNSKIPTVIYYDKLGNMRAAGAEAITEHICGVAQDEQWVKAEWFKLHLRGTSQEYPPLPPNKSAVEVFADFMRYLLACSSSYIRGNRFNGGNFWNSVESNIDFVLSHPNGWGENERRQMRRAAVLAGMIPDDAHGHARIFFVTEGEASLHFAISNGLPPGLLSKGGCVAVVDAGGGTIDTSFYAKTTNTSPRSTSVPPIMLGGTRTNQRSVVSTSPISPTSDSVGTKSGRLDTLIDDNCWNKDAMLKEVAPPQCDMQGSVFVTIRARIYLEHYLADSSFSEDIDHFVSIFDKSTKLLFRSDTDTPHIKFGAARDGDPKLNIRFGKLKLHGSDVALLFQPSIDSIVNGILKQPDLAISHVVLVGGFAASDWLIKRVVAALEPHGLSVFRPETPVNKAVADGAVSLYLNHILCNRV